MTLPGAVACAKAAPPDKQAWDASAAAFVDNAKELAKLVNDHDMDLFARIEGGVLTDAQVDSLVKYLSATIPARPVAVGDPTWLRAIGAGPDRGLWR